MYMFLAFKYIIIVYCQTHFDLLFSVITNCVTYSMSCATCFVHSSINLVNVYEKLDLFDIHSIKQSWKYVDNQIKSPGMSWKTTFTVLCAPCFTGQVHCFDAVSQTSVELNAEKNVEKKQKPLSSVGNGIGPGTSAWWWHRNALVIPHLWQLTFTVSGAGTRPSARTATAPTRRSSIWCSSVRPMITLGGTPGQETPSLPTRDASGAT